MRLYLLGSLIKIDVVIVEYKDVIVDSLNVILLSYAFN